MMPRTLARLEQLAEYAAERWHDSNCESNLFWKASSLAEHELNKAQADIATEGVVAEEYEWRRDRGDIG